MNYWLDLFTPYTWSRFREHGGVISGFRPRQRNAAFNRVKQGDCLVCYLVKLSRWCGVLEVASEAFEDSTPIFTQTNDPFTIRFHVIPQVALDFEYAIPIKEAGLWGKLSFTRGLELGAFGWAQTARLRQSLVQIGRDDGELLVRMLKQQTEQKRRYALEADELRQIANRTVVRMEEREIEVEVPERENTDVLLVAAEPERRASTKMQAQVAQLGLILGFAIWVPANDRGKILEALPVNSRDSFVSALPLNYDIATLKTIENIDVIWLDRRSIAHAFEIEHTTSIYSGLLRMADLLAMQPRMNISLHIVAPVERRDQVRREIVRPVFSVMEGGTMAERCSFLSYDAIEEILAQPNLSHMRESILENFEEYFDI